MLIYKKNFLLLWKPHGIPSTFGKQKSFLELKRDILEKYIDLKFGDEKYLQEYGLLNRLDNDTAGFLYFARNYKFYLQFKKLQADGKIYKYYIADVYGDYRKFGKSLICYPIMHHKFLKEKMVAIKKFQDLSRGRGKLHYVETEVDFLYYDKEKNISSLFVYIKKGIRHQIRVHLASIGYPIVGDKLYAKNVKEDRLHLWSVGFRIG